MRDYEHQEIAYENAVASRYNRDYHSYPIMKHWNRAFAMYVTGQLVDGDRVLDLGCGPASLWGFWKNNPKKLGVLVGADISPRMISEAKRLFPKDNFLVGNSQVLPFVTGSFDVVIVSSVLHHIPDEYLPDTLQEIYRVLDEHGMLVGREPLGTGRLHDDSGWLSGALMNFRHMVYSLTRTREYPEPEVGEHHHAYAVADFVEFLKKVPFFVADLQLQNPLSVYVARASHPTIVKLAIWLDKALSGNVGNEFFYTARKNHSTAGAVAYAVARRLEELGKVPNEPEFLALLQAAAERINKELGGTHNGNTLT